MGFLWVSGAEKLMEMLSTWDLGPGVQGCLEGSAARERGPGRCGQGHRQPSAAGPAEEVRAGAGCAR